MIGVMGRVWFLTVSMSVLQLTTSSEITRLHLYNRRKTTWNHAQEMCESIGMNLVTVDSPEVITAISILVEVRIWDFFDDVWTGLHNYDANSPDLYAWVGGCRPLQPNAWNLWWQNTADAAKRCVRIKNTLLPDVVWEARQCQSNDGEVLCETSYQGDCGFQEIPHRFLDPTMDSQVSVNVLFNVSLSECQTACRDHEGSPSCWAVKHLDSTCVLYLTDGISALYGILRLQAGVSVHFRFCFTGTLDPEDFTVKYKEPENAEPWKGCNETVNETPPPTVTATRPPNTTTTGFQTTGSTKDTATSVEIPTATTTTESLTWRVTAEAPATTSTEAMTTTPTEVNTALEDGTSVSTAPRSTMIEKTATTTTTESETNTSPEKTPTQFGEITASTDIRPTTDSDSQEEVCACPCWIYPNLTTEEKEELIQEIITNLTIDTSKVSKTRRKYESAYDPRPSAQIVGGVGVAIICLVLGGLFLMDVGALARDLASLWHTLREKP